MPSNNLQQNSVWGVTAGLMPEDGPLILRVPCDLTAGANTVDLLKEIAADWIDFIQAVFIDNSQGNAPLILNVSVTGHRIQCPPNSQGVFTVLMPPGGSRIDVSGPAAVYTLLFSNAPFAPSVWKATA